MISKLQYITQDVPGRTHPQLAEAACAAGIDWIQLRVKNRSCDEWRAIALETLAVCRKYGVKLIINDGTTLAKEIGADGVHLGKNDMSTAEARSILGNDVIIGGTANTFEDIKMHVANGVDYVGLGPFRFTNTKEKLSPILGPEGYSNILQKCAEENIRVPVIAIGGILPDDVSAILDAGMYGIAVSSAITNSEDKHEIIFKFQLALNSPAGQGRRVGERRLILPYEKELIKRAKELRKNSTLGEIILWKNLKGKQRKGFDFDRQRVIGNYIVDFYSKDLMLAIEVDGLIHDFQQEHDANRQAVLENMGVSFLRFTDHKVKNDIPNVLGEIDLWIERSGKKPWGSALKPTPNPSREENNTAFNKEIK